MNGIYTIDPDADKDTLCQWTKIKNSIFQDAEQVYVYGSRVYGTVNDKSDYDFIVVMPNNIMKDEIECGKINVKFYERYDFYAKIKEHDISALECMYLDNRFKFKERIVFGNPKINLQKLRHSISLKASHAWVKAKKKMTVEKDFDLYRGQKSLFHSLRIINFGTQIAIHNRIKDYSAANKYYEQIVGNSSQDWKYYDELFREEKNSLMTEFRKLAPKD